MSPHVSVVLVPAADAASVAASVESVRAQRFADWELLIVEAGGIESTTATAITVAGPASSTTTTADAAGLASSTAAGPASSTRATVAGPASSTTTTADAAGPASSTAAGSASSAARGTRHVAGRLGGVVIARNRGLFAAAGRYVAVLDGGHVWEADKLALQAELLDAEDGLGFCCFGEVTGHGPAGDGGVLGGPTGHAPGPTGHAPGPGGRAVPHASAPHVPIDVVELLAGRTTLAACSIMVRRDLLIAVGGWDSTYSQPGAADLHLVTRLLRASRGAILRPRVALPAPSSRGRTERDELRRLLADQRRLARMEGDWRRRLACWRGSLAVGHDRRPAAIRPGTVPGRLRGPDGKPARSAAAIPAGSGPRPSTVRVGPAPDSRGADPPVPSGPAPGLRATVVTAERAPRVSVVLPTIGPAPWLDEALRSVRDQTLADWELIIVDNDSTRELADLVADEARARVVCQPMRGIAFARNTGIAAAIAPYVAFLDDDDRWHATKLARQVDQLERDLSLVGSCTGVDVIDAAGGTVVPAGPRPATTYDNLLAARANVLPSSLMARRELLTGLGGADPSYQLADDVPVVLRLLALGPCGRLDDALTEYRWHADNISSRYARQGLELLRVLADHRRLALLRRQPARWARSWRGAAATRWGLSRTAWRKAVESARAGRRRPETAHHVLRIIVLREPGRPPRRTRRRAGGSS